MAEYYSERQDYLSGDSTLSAINSIFGNNSFTAGQVQSNNTAVSARLKKQCPILKFESLKPYKIDSEATLQRYFRNADLIADKARRLAGSEDNWYDPDRSALVTISDWASYDLNPEGAFVINVFNSDGVLLTQGHNYFTLVSGGVLYVYLKYCTNWDTETFALSSGTFSETVSVVAIRNDEDSTPDSYNPIACSGSGYVQSGFTAGYVAKPIGTDEDPFTSELLETQELPDYLEFSHADFEKFYSEEFELKLVVQAKSLLIEVPESYTNRAYIQSSMNTRKEYTFTIRKEHYDVIAQDTHTIRIVFKDTSVSSLDLSYTFFADSDVTTDEELKFTISKLYTDSRFFLVNRCNKFYDDITVSKLEDGSYSISDRRYGNQFSSYISNRAYSSNTGVLYCIPLEKYVIHSADTEGSDPEGDTNIHAIPCYCPNAEDVMVWVNGVKLVPNVNYIVVDNYFSDYAASPAILIITLAPEIEAGETHAFIQACSFPKPQLGKDVNIRVIVGNVVSDVQTLNAYVGTDVYNYPTRTTDQPVSNVFLCQSDNHQYGIARPNGSVYPAIRQRDSQVPFSIIPYDSILVFQEGRYIPQYPHFRDRIIANNIIALRGITNCYDLEILSVFNRDKSTQSVITAHADSSALVDAYIREHLDSYLSSVFQNSLHAAMLDSSDDPTLPTVDTIVAKAGESPIEHWLRLNAILASREAGDPTIYVRYSTTDATMDASLDLNDDDTLYGDITIDGSEPSPGLFQSTETFINSEDPQDPIND